MNERACINCSSLGDSDNQPLALFVTHSLMDEGTKVAGFMSRVWRSKNKFKENDVAYLIIKGD